VKEIWLVSGRAILLLFVCKCVLPPGDNPIAVNEYIISYRIPPKQAGWQAPAPNSKTEKMTNWLHVGNSPFCDPVSKAQLYEAIKSVHTQEQNLPS